MPVAVSFCTHFLFRERRHIYRQVCGIRHFESWVVTRTRVNGREFPFPRLHVLRKSPTRFLRLWRPRNQRLAPLDLYEVDQLLRFTRAREAVVVHTYFGTEAARLIEYYRRETCARVVSFHGADLTEAALPEARLREVCDAADLLLCRSQSLAALLEARGGPRKRIRINRTGVPLPEPGPAREGPRPGPGRPLRLLQACRFVAKKGLDVSVRAVAELRARGLPAILTLAGEGPERERLVTLVHALGLMGCVRFAGFLTEAALGAEMRAHDVFVHPSRTAESGDLEGIPNSILEAMAHGLPVVATSHGGIPEAIAHERSGLLLPEAAPEAVAAAAERLARDSGLYRALAAGGRAAVEATFSVETCVAALEDHYREAVALARTRR